ncbi:MULTISPECIES: hypothetical protein [Pectobacterium]|uniref:Uncharacterized protein n=1 Tax=Pectobacterium carotovorum TaxID=554 RepID=A0A419AWC5_PECCA|nr:MULTISPECIES: hypothetical protein [Pectobacterium]MBN3265533.1 hypothetical protein [Pectobacterium brasiliense]RJL51515.1 hypothetical protein D5071_10465 [Pectobacterium carotovorum]
MSSDAENDTKMYLDDKITLAFNQTGNLLAGYLAAHPKELPDRVIKDFFEVTYKALAEELKKSYIRKSF